MAQQYKHAVPANDHDLICNHKLFDVSPAACDVDVLGGVLNSSWVVLSKFQYGRPVGVEGNLKTEVIDVKMMLVPDPRGASERALARVAAAFRRMKQRKLFSFLSEQRFKAMKYRQMGKEKELAALSDVSELDMADRRELDDAVLELVGIRSRSQRETLRGELYEYLRDFFEWTRQKEERAIANKGVARRRGQVRPEEIAAQLFEEIRQRNPELLRAYDPGFLDPAKPFDTYELPGNGTPVLHRDMYDGVGVDFKKGKRTIAAVHTRWPEQDLVLLLVADAGIRGLVRVPYEREECRRVEKKFGRFVRQREAIVRSMVEQRTTDEDLQAEIVEALMSLLVSSRA